MNFKPTDQSRRNMAYVRSVEVTLNLDAEVQGTLL